MPKFNCEKCETEFYRAPSYLKRHKARFCSLVCLNQHQKEESKKYTATFNCGKCGKEVTKKRSQLRGSVSGINYCSVQCKNEDIIKRRWSSDYIPNSHKDRRKKLIENVGEKCQHCGLDEDKRLLDIHHFDGNHKNNKSNNLRVLCVLCHAKHHRLGLDLSHLPEIE